MQLIRIAENIFPVDLIETITITSLRGVDPDSISLTIKGVPGTFDYNGDYARRAVDELVGNGHWLIVGVDVIDTNTIEWADMSASLNNTVGVEIRVSTDAPDTTRQFFGRAAEIARTQLISCAVNGNNYTGSGTGVGFTYTY